MKILNIVNRKRESLAKVTWETPNRVSVEISEATDEDTQSALQEFIDECCSNGVNLRTGKQMEQDGKTVLVDEKIQITTSDERFLSALSDAVSRNSFGEHKARVFGLLQEQQAK
ncbi:MAG: hypothetical protein HC836_37500 [Richelia sp. RM2_1_2]|nr:hypothetical protein [Richelia sp. RM1_1_1]NJO63682.1 hypothetical protein [Richelia sp. RM2_1_2]